MAQPYPQAYAQTSKGTLVPGQQISVNKYTVQVERYLSQGGFAHVYLVRTAQQVYNTTQHVLKRIAVPTEVMLTEVKKEVDIMRILKGHPNIVHLIDAAWHRLPDGTFEVFILMEFCAGGGIIDMMNRRLRERLTEMEILTIFVDVCEGLAAMHALKPPLLHRDLKVENILQASVTSYKLCDFGSATPVQKIPTNSQEIRMLETDLNRHTTLQYRAPEMVDLYQRRPIDEKSDVWALGVLLYKLCYYTTPFEEHGPLAILNVQYKIPPYPVYSTQMNALIASMLREHNSQRPSVFEILTHVHKLRGTKSRFAYNVPPKEPPLSPRSTTAPLQAISPNIVSPSVTQPGNMLDELVSFKSQQPLSSSPSKNAGTDARDRVLEAIAPMRRGRPSPAQAPVITPPASPKKVAADKFELDMKFGTDDDKAWRGVRGHKSGLASFGGSSNAVNLNAAPGTDAWALDPRARKPAPGAGEDAARKAFESDFSGFGKSFGDEFQPQTGTLPMPARSQPVPVLAPQSTAPSPKPLSRSPGNRVQPPALRAPARDAFDGLGLGLAAPAPQPTLGEARKSRTGLASFGVTSPSAGSPPVASQYLGSGLGSSNTMYRPPSSHSPMPAAPPSPKVPQPQISSPMPPPVQSWRQQAKTPSSQELTPEERFPSLEDLDRTFASPPLSTPPEKHIPPPHAASQPTGLNRPPSRASVSSHVRERTEALMSESAATGAGAARGRFDGVRSQHVTGAAMRESASAAPKRQSMFVRPVPAPTGGYSSRQDTGQSQSFAARAGVGAGLVSRPSVLRRDKSALGGRGVEADLLSPRDSAASPSIAPELPPRPLPQPSPWVEPRDWLTGADDDDVPLAVRAAAVSDQPVMRGSPSKRASYIERSPVELHVPLAAESVDGPENPGAAFDLEREVQAQMKRNQQVERERLERERKSEKEPQKEQRRSISPKKRASPVRPKAIPSRANTGTGSMSAAPTGTGRNLQLPPVDTKVAARSAPSPNGLTENWSPVSPKRQQSKASTSSSEEEGPEDVNGYALRSGEPEVEELAAVRGTDRSSPTRNRKAAHKGRQSSVHDLVDLWSDKDKVVDDKSGVTAKADKRRSVIMPAPTSKPTFFSNKPRPVSPQLVDTSSRPSSPAIKQSRSSPSPHRRQPSPAPSVGYTTGMVHAPAATKSRPQSMFMAPSNRPLVHAPKTAALSNLSAKAPSSENAASSSLSPPATPAAAQRAMRRSSISDMVQRYEAIGSPTRIRGPSTGAGPPAASKPFSLAAPPREDNTETHSPSAAAARFPKLSPETSPVMQKASLAVPSDAGSKGPAGLPPRMSPIGRTEASAEQVNGLPVRRSPFQPSRALAEVRPASSVARESPVVSPFPGRSASQQSAAEDASVPGVRSPSPERPYQGVSKLIDRWNRAVDDTPGENPSAPRRGGFVARRAGMVGGDSNRGR